MDGWIKLWRKIVESEVFQNPNVLKMFIWCLAMAAHKEVWVPVRVGRGVTPVRLEPGQLICGRRQLARVLGVNPSSARNWLHFLEDAQILDISKGPHYSIVSIRNWKQYQVEETCQKDHKRTTKGPQKDTYNNDKNDKKEIHICAFAHKFASFWDAYGKKIDKAKCMKWYEKHGDVLHEAIMEGVRKWKESGNWDDAQFQPYPITFLRNRRWEDEPPIRMTVEQRQQIALEEKFIKEGRL